MLSLPGYLWHTIKIVKLSGHNLIPKMQYKQGKCCFSTFFQLKWPWRVHRIKLALKKKKKGNKVFTYIYQFLVKNSPYAVSPNLFLWFSYLINHTTKMKLLNNVRVGFGSWRGGLCREKHMSWNNNVKSFKL